MSVSQVSVCNSALVKVGAERISSIDENTKRAIILKAIYDTTRDAVLRAHPWHFATKRETLVPTATTPAFGYQYEYDLPNDCLKVIDCEVLSREDIDFQVESRKIRTDWNEINILYVFQQTDESEWDSCFAEAMAWALAGQIAYNLTQSITLAQSCEQKYRAVLAEARSMNGTEGVLKGLIADDWTNSRRS